MSRHALVAEIRERLLREGSPRAAVVLGGAFALGYAVCIAPVLLAEVALDAALVTAVYRRMRRYESSGWAVSVMRRTWLAALGLIVLLTAAGFALQKRRTICTFHRRRSARAVRWLAFTL